jgi:hypothetical protein
MYDSGSFTACTSSMIIFPCADYMVHVKWGEVDISAVGVTHLSRDSIQHDPTLKKNLQLLCV